MNRLFLFGLVLAWCPAGPAAAEMRTWTNAQGRTVQAEIIAATETTVTFKMANGQEATVNQTTLSPADGEYIKKWRAEAKPAAPAAPAEPTAEAAVVMGAGFDAEWPDVALVPEELGINIVTEDEAEKEFVYRSKHFEFTSDVQLRPRLVNACAKIFEATHEFLRVLPLNHRLSPVGKTHFPVYFFADYDDYVKAGGPPGSAGVCMTRGDDTKVLVPLRSMGVRRIGSDYTVDSKDGDNRILPHEITHQVMERTVKRASWYIEGSAEYVAHTPYTGGRFRIGSNRSAIIEAVTAYGKDNIGGNALGKEIRMSRLRDFMELPYENFVADSRLNYGLGCLLTYYFYHQDGEGDAKRIKDYLRELQSGRKETDAREKLLDGRTWEEMEDALAKGMRRFGVKLSFKGRD
jgi:hypothetical protein